MSHVYGIRIKEANATLSVPIPDNICQNMRKLIQLLPLSALLLAPLFAGCSASSGGNAPPYPPSARAAHPSGTMHLLIGVDISGSTGSDPMTRKRYCAQIEDTVDTIMPRATPVTIWFYDTAARIHFGPQKLQEGSELRPVEKEILAYHSDNRGTRQSAPLLAMLPIVKDLESKGDSAVCMLLTDSEDDDGKATKEVAGKLAAVHAVRAVCVSGAKTEAKYRNFMRQKLTEALAPLGERAVITGEGTDSQGGLDRLRTLSQGGP